MGKKKAFPSKNQEKKQAAENRNKKIENITCDEQLVSNGAEIEQRNLKSETEEPGESDPLTSSQPPSHEGCPESAKKRTENIVSDEQLVTNRAEINEKSETDKIGNSEPPSHEVCPESAVKQTDIISEIDEQMLTNRADIDQNNQKPETEKIGKSEPLTSSQPPSHEVYSESAQKHPDYLIRVDGLNAYANITDRGLRSCFDQFGQILKICVHSTPGNRFASAEIFYIYLQHAINAAKESNGVTFNGSTILVSVYLSTRSGFSYYESIIQNVNCYSAASRNSTTLTSTPTTTNIPPAAENIFATASTSTASTSQLNGCGYDVGNIISIILNQIQVFKPTYWAVNVDSLVYETEEIDVRDIFGLFGTIAKVEITKVPLGATERKQPFTMADIYYETEEAAQRCILYMDKTFLNGRKILVTDVRVMTRFVRVEGWPMCDPYEGASYLFSRFDPVVDVCVDSPSWDKFYLNVEFKSIAAAKHAEICYDYVIYKDKKLRVVQITHLKKDINALW